MFKWTSIDPNVKCSEIVASINVEKVTPGLLTTITELLIDILPVYGLHIAFGTSDAAGCNWVAFNSLSDTTITPVLPTELIEK